MHIEFNPIRGSDVVLPPGGTFVISNSLTVSNKAETGPMRYNLRVVECRLASILLALGLGTERKRAAGFQALNEVEALAKQQGLVGDLGKAARLSSQLVSRRRWGQGRRRTAPALVAGALVDSHLHQEPYTPEEVEGVLGQPLEQVFEGRPNQLRVIQALKAPGGSGRLFLWSRAKHVWSEKQRVLDFKATCMEGEGAPAERLARLGQLMDASHTSCRDWYDCSCAELEEVISVAKGAGALGSRLTGAGWGGCAVSLVRDEDVERFIQALQDKFYSKRIASGIASREQLPDLCFATKPAQGGASLDLDVSKL